MLRTLKTALVFVSGMLVGWLGMGWVLFPVQWTNAEITDLRPSAKASYLLLVADSYALDGDLGKARALVAPLDQEEAADLLAALIADRYARGAVVEAERLQALADALLLRPGPLGPAALGPEQPGVDAFGQPDDLREEPAPPAALPQPADLDELRVDTTRLAIACGLGAGLLFFLTLVVTVAAVRRVRARRSSALPRAAYFPQAPPPAARSAARSKNRFGTTYNLGDDGYDASFTLEGPQGEFLGECGVSQGEILEAGVPVKVRAFEVWLFDHREVRTVTKLLLCPHGYHDAALRSKLAARGEAVLAEVGRVLVLETGNLRCQAEVLQAQYAEQDTSPDAYFTRLSVDLAVTVLSA